MKQALPDFKIRLPQELKSAIEEAAKTNSRSMNGEIIARLERTFAEDANDSGGAGSVADLQRQIDELRERMDRIILKNELADPDTGLDMEVSAEGGSGSLLKNRTR